MYQAFYGLSRKPFTLTPDPSVIYWGRGHRLAFTMLQYGIMNDAGITVITGSIGCGKTTMISHLLGQLDRDVRVGVLSTLHRGVDSLLSWVLMAFDQPFEGLSEVALTAQLERFLRTEHNAGRKVILVVDEAQNLGTELLEQLRALSNFTMGAEPLLRLILVGQPQLRTLLQQPDMVQFVQRVASDFHIKPLGPDEVGAYITTRLESAGRRDPVFTPAAIARIYDVTHGVPRLINLLADMALVYGFSAGEMRINRATIDDVVADKGEYGVFAFTDDLSTDPKAAKPNGTGVPPPNQEAQKPALVVHDPVLAARLLDRLEEK